MHFRCAEDMLRFVTRSLFMFFSLYIYSYMYIFMESWSERVVTDTGPLSQWSWVVLIWPRRPACSKNTCYWKTLVQFATSWVETKLVLTLIWIKPIRGRGVCVYVICDGISSSLVGTTAAHGRRLRRPPVLSIASECILSPVPHICFHIRIEAR